MIYLDCAATKPMTKKAKKAYLKASWGNPSSLHSMGKEAYEDLKKAKERIADCIGCKKDEIYFTSGGTESNNWAIEILLKNCTGNIGVSKIEHPATTNKVKRDGKSRVVGLNVNKDGIIN